MTARTGEWPVTEPVDLEAAEASDVQGVLHLELTRVQARFEMAIGSVRADLREQPSEACVRSAARRWCNDIIAAADEVVNNLRSTT
ncbi:hypothetical protein ACFWDI_35750 [Streptomyces sp. NPDC060064]|uniref:hypothetical protein n=1 Tax=Streptomyces sp. NPDC060064 TaxID=3347049 RepID=UPI0036A766AC